MNLKPGYGEIIQELTLNQTVLFGFPNTTLKTLVNGFGMVGVLVPPETLVSNRTTGFGAVKIFRAMFVVFIRTQTVIKKVGDLPINQIYHGGC